MMLAGVVSSGGLTALLRKIRAKLGNRNSVQHSNQKEAPWAK